MRPLLLLFSAAVAATVSLQRRQDNRITISSTDIAGSLCSNDSTSITVSNDGNIVTVAFDEYIVSTPVGLSRGDCAIDMILTYPPGCTTALMQTTLHSFFAGNEAVTSFMDVAVSLSTGRQLTASEVYRSQGPALELGGVSYARRYPMDASISINEEDPAEIVFSISVESQIQSVDGTDGSFTMDDITIAFDTSRLDPDWEYCVQYVTVQEDAITIDP